MTSVNPIAYFTMILYSFFPELGNTTTADGNFRCVLYSVALFALWVLGMFGFNWKVEIFELFRTHQVVLKPVKARRAFVYKYIVAPLKTLAGVGVLIGIRQLIDHFVG